MGEIRTRKENEFPNKKKKSFWKMCKRNDSFLSMRERLANQAKWVREKARRRKGEIWMSFAITGSVRNDLTFVEQTTKNKHCPIAENKNTCLTFTCGWQTLSFSSRTHIRFPNLLRKENNKRFVPVVCDWSFKNCSIPLLQDGAPEVGNFLFHKFQISFPFPFRKKITGIVSIFHLYFNDKTDEMWSLLFVN